MNLKTLATGSIAVALAAPMAAPANAPDPDTGAFWYQESRNSYPGATPAATQSTVVSTVPQVSGAPAFDSGIGDIATAAFASEFSSNSPSTTIIFR